LVRGDVLVVLELLHLWLQLLGLLAALRLLAGRLGLALLRAQGMVHQGSTQGGAAVAHAENLLSTPNSSSPCSIGPPPCSSRGSLVPGGYQGGAGDKGAVPGTS
jgi:hypothetical protein